MKTDFYEVVICIVNAGYSDVAMDAAKECGASGGTLLNARGIAAYEAEKLFNLSIQPEKEMLMIILDKSKRDDVLHALYKSVGLQTEAQGIIISLPIEQIAGNTPKSEKKERKTDDDPPVKQQ